MAGVRPTCHGRTRVPRHKGLGVLGYRRGACRAATLRYRSSELVDGGAALHIYPRVACDGSADGHWEV